MGPIRMGALATAAVLVIIAAAAHAAITAEVISQLGCPLKVEKLTVVYGPTGTKYQPSFYADANPGGKDKLWLNGSFTNEGDDPITQFTFDVKVYDVAGAKVWEKEDVFDQPVREKKVGKEWSWELEGGAGVVTVVFIPRVLSFPGGRKWETDERFVKAKFEEKGLKE